LRLHYRRQGSSPEEIIFGEKAPQSATMTELSWEILRAKEAFQDDKPKHQSHKFQRSLRSMNTVCHFLLEFSLLSTTVLGPNVWRPYEHSPAIDAGFV
jgi:hypothetical protein